MAEQSGNSVWKAGFSYGLILGAVSVISSVVFYILGETMSGVERYVSLGLFVVMLCYFLYMYREEYMGGFVSHGRLIGLGVIISVVAGIIGGFYLIVLLKWIDPSVQNIIDEKSVEKMLQQLAKRDIYPTQGEIDDMMEGSKFFRTPLFLGIAGIINLAIIGLIISAIAGIFIKKVSKDPFAEVSEKE